MNSADRKQAGVTLIELMVALSVLAILATVAAPSFARFMEKSRLRGAADEMASLIASARGEAVKRGRDVTISMGGTAAAWCIGANEAPTPAVAAQFATSAACDCTVSTACLVDGGRRVVSSGEYGGVTASAVTASLTIDGKVGSVVGLSSTSVTLTSAGSNFQLQLTVSPLGQTRVCVPSGQTAIPGYPSC